jgi:hypothetical protein
LIAARSRITRRPRTQADQFGVAGASGLAALLDELEVLGDRGEDAGSLPGHQVSLVLGFSGVEHGCDVDLQAGAAQGDSDGVLGDLEVVGDLCVAVDLDAALAKPFQESGFVHGEVGGAEVGGDISVGATATPFDGRELGGAAGRPELDQVEDGALGNVPLQPLSEVVDLTAAFRSLRAGHIDLALGE